MPVAHILLALLVTLIWGLNFVVIKVGLGDFPPLLFCALRFALAALPLLVLRGPMPAPFGRILLIGVLLGVVKFGLLFVGMAQGMPAGLSSLVLQSQVFFTILIAALWLGERPTPRGLFGLLLAAAGLVLIGLERPLGDSLLAFLLVVAAALAWSFANIATKRSGATDMLRLICLLLACVQPSRAEDGCLSYVLHRSLDEAGRFVFVERWADRDAIERHRRMPHYRAMADAVADLLADRQVFLLEELPAASLSPVDPEPTRPHEE